MLRASYTQTDSDTETECTASIRFHFILQLCKDWISQYYFPIPEPSVNCPQRYIELWEKSNDWDTMCIYNPYFMGNGCDGFRYIQLTRILHLWDYVLEITEGRGIAEGYNWFEDHMLQEDEPFCDINSWYEKQNFSKGELTKIFTLMDDTDIANAGRNYVQKEINFSFEELNDDDGIDEIEKEYSYFVLRKAIESTIQDYRASVKIQAIFRGHNARWKCPCFTFR